MDVLCMIALIIYLFQFLVFGCYCLKHIHRSSNESVTKVKAQRCGVVHIMVGVAPSTLVHIYFVVELAWLHIYLYILLCSPTVFSGVSGIWSLVFCVVFCRSLFVLLSFFFGSLCCLIFYDLRLQITPLVSSNSSYIKST